MAYDDIIVGAGHNGLAAAAYLARAGRRVLVLEALDRTGGAAISAPVFPGMDVRLSRYAYLVSLLPQTIVRDLALDIRLVRRRFSSYTPLPADPRRGLLVDGDAWRSTRAGLRALTGGDEAADGWWRLSQRIGHLARRVWPTLLEPLRSAEQMRAAVDDDELWQALTERPMGELIDAYVRDDLVAGIIATDGLIGTFASLDDATGPQNICFLYHVIGGGSGDWDVPVGGMGRVSEALGDAARRAGATILTGAEVVAVDPGGEVCWRDASGLRTERAGSVLAGCAPATLDRLLAAAGVPPLGAGPAPEGSQLKINMLLRRLPRLRDPQVDPTHAFAGTFHINESRGQLEAAYRDACAGRVPSLPPCEMYCHTLSDRSILGPQLVGTDAHTLTLFGLHMPARLFREDNAARRVEAVTATLASLNSVLGEPVESLLMSDANGAPCIEARTPVDLEADLGLPGGNIFHRPLQWPWAERPQEIGTWGVETPHARLRICGAGARRGGGVSAIAGHNAARSILEA